MFKPLTSPAAPDTTWRLHGVAATGAAWRPALLVREQRPANGDRSRPVLYVHGATFPSDASIMFRFEGGSWADSLNAAGFDVFGLDFAGYGGSERYPAMASDAPGPPLGRAPETADQVARAVRMILEETGAKQLVIIAHSWGSLPAAAFSADHPDQVQRLVLFGPITRRHDAPPPNPIPPWRDINIAQQHARFVAEVPPGEAQVLAQDDFPRWTRTYLAADPAAAGREPPAVRTPNGPTADIAEAWFGRLPYDPARIRAPTLIVRGDWDRVCDDRDARGLCAALTGSSQARVVTIPRATHLMHLETGRQALYDATNAFLTEAPSA